MTSPKAPSDQTQCQDDQHGHLNSSTTHTTPVRTAPVLNAKVQWNEKGQPISSAFDDVYFSTENGLEETRYVFLAGNQLRERWATLHDHARFTIVETGFGTGLNFLATWQLWNQCSRANQHLHFVSIERYPLTHEALTQALALWPELNDLAQTLLAHYPPQPWPKAQTIELPAADNRLAVTLTLYFSDTKDAIHEFSAKLSPHAQVAKQAPAFGEQRLYVDSWFLDGFAPSKNPDMWTDELYQAMAANSAAGTHLATFTAAGNVRRGLQAQGFSCTKRKGFGRKREMLVGEFVGKQALPDNHATETITTTEGAATSAQAAATKHNTQGAAQKRDIQRVAHTRIPTWPLKASNAVDGGDCPASIGAAANIDVAPSSAANTHTRTASLKANNNKTAIVIGAGLAGAHTANALARRGIRVTVIERSSIAEGASGNAQGAVYTRLSDSDDPLSTFNLSTQLFADQFYQNHGYYQRCGKQCGVMHLATNEASKKRFQRFVEQFSVAADEDATCAQNNHARSYFRYVDPSDMPKMTGLALDYHGLFLSQSGWLNPPSLCRELLQHENIKVFENTEVHALDQTEDGWQAHSHSQTFSADYCMICNAAAAKRFAATSHLPLTNIRGQVSHIETNPTLSQLKTVLCGVGYLPPATDIDGYASHCIGATFNLKNSSCELSDSDHASNLTALDTLKITDGNATRLNSARPGKVGFRCSTPDYFPVVGPVPKLAKMLDQFEFLSKKANADVDSCGHYYPGLYCNLGFGSRGLAYAPLAAKLLSNLVCGDMLCLPRSLYLHLHPARFAIRSLIKNKPLKPVQPN